MRSIAIKRGKVILYGAITLLCILAFTIYNLNGAFAATASSNLVHVSVNNTGDGQGANATIVTYKISANGRYVAFSSGASNLVDNDTNGKNDIFVRDLKLNTTERVSISSSGTESNANSTLYGISESGRYVLYETNATNLEAGPTIPGNFGQTYVYDRQTNTNTYYSVAPWQSGIAAPTTISNDGRIILGTATYAVSNGSGGTVSSPQVVYYDTDAGSWFRLTQPPGDLHAGGDQPDMSCDGSFAVFRSNSTNLVAEPDANGSTQDIFLADLRHGEKLVNLTSNFNNHNMNPHISCNGNYITFTSTATNIVSGVTSGSHIYVYDRLSGEFALVNQESNGASTVSPASFRHVTDQGRVFYVNGITPPARGYYRVYDVDAQSTQHVRDENNQTMRADTYGYIHIHQADADGKVALFYSSRTDILPNDSNGFNELFATEITY